MEKPSRFKPEKTVIQMGADRGNDVVLTLTHGKKGFFIRTKQGPVDVVSTPTTLEVARWELRKLLAHYADQAFGAGFPVEYVRRPTGRKIPCTGEAHKNVFIDHCMVCLGGTWGEINELEPFSLDYAKLGHFDVPAPMLNQSEFFVMEQLMKAGEVEFVSVHRGNAYYSVYRWVKK